MPEMPEVEGLRAFLDAHLTGRTITRAELAAFSALKTFNLPLSALVGLEVSGVTRQGKFLLVATVGVHLAFHLARAGWLSWYETPPATTARPGKGPIALRMVFDDEVGFDLTEAGTQKKLALYVVADPAEVPGISSLGVDPMADGFTADAFAGVLAEHARTQVKGLLRDQRVFAGIGNAYSDEILRTAKLSPFKLAGKLTDEERTVLYAAVRAELATAIDRAVGLSPNQLKDDKRSHLRVHGRKGEPCAECGTPIEEVSFADSFWNYCPGCQTGGQKLADRRLSRLLK